MQHHFTTPEQAKALLELGVPQTSADMYCFRDVAGNLYYNMVPSWQPIFSKERFWNNFPHDYTPIWSVGQIVEICLTCIDHYTGDDRLIFDKDTLRLGIIECLIATIKGACNDGDIDLSKLED